jgi:carboxylesterase
VEDLTFARRPAQDSYRPAQKGSRHCRAARQLLELRWLVQQVKQELSQIKQPALIVHSREDDRASLRNPYFLQERLGGSTQTVVLDDNYHIVILDG